MCTTLLGINVITKTGNAFCKFINILECHFHLNAFLLFFEVNNVCNCFFSFIHIRNISSDTIFFMECNCLLFTHTLILKNNGEFRIQIGSLMKSALNRICFEIYLFKNFRIRKKANRGTGIRLTAFSNFLQVITNLSLFVALIVNDSISSYIHFQPQRQGINNG